MDPKMKEYAKKKIVSPHLQEFADLCTQGIASLNLFPKKDLFIDVLINPASGRVRNGSPHTKMKKNLKKALLKKQEENKEPYSGKTPSIVFHETMNKKQGEELAVKLVEKRASSKTPSAHLLILAGGDGFHHDILEALYISVPKLLKKVIIFRLPLGTGNDSSDAPNIKEVINLLSAAPSVVDDSLITLSGAKGEKWHASNIVSFGLDAYVCELTNRMKHMVGPQFIFSLFTNVSILFYEKHRALQNWKITVNTKEGKEIREGKFLINAFGRRGNTRYGGGMTVLPSTANYVLIKTVPLPQKLKIKNMMAKKTHLQNPNVEAFETKTIQLDYEHAIELECDGECYLLEKEDFPLKIKIISNAFKTLKI